MWGTVSAATGVRQRGCRPSALREEIARRRISRQGLAETARLSMSTLEKALSGSRPFTLATVIRLEDALGTPAARARPRRRQMLSPALAPPHMGSYAREAVRWIEGRLSRRRAGEFWGMRARFTLTAPRSCGTPASGHLVFVESDRIDGVFAQAGHVSMPNLSGHIYLADERERAIPPDHARPGDARAAHVRPARRRCRSAWARNSCR